MLWMLPIFIGTFLRGPNWSFFGPFSIRDAGVLPDYENVKLSEWFWRYLLGRTASIDGENAGSTATVLLRESPGIVLLSLYYFLLPLLLLRTRWRTVHREMGTFGYVAFMFLLLTMFLIPLKMLFRWVFDVSYLVSIPIWNFNL
jgi:hypothetical protein